MKKPTLAQLKKRPALWIHESGEASITYPESKNEYYSEERFDWLYALITRESYLKYSSWEFVSWL